MVETAQGIKITARAIVVATNTPVNDLVAMHTKQAPYRSYVIAARIPTGAVPHRCYGIHRTRTTTSSPAHREWP